MVLGKFSVLLPSWFLKPNGLRCGSLRLRQLLVDDLLERSCGLGPAQENAVDKEGGPAVDAGRFSLARVFVRFRLVFPAAPLDLIDLDQDVPFTRYLKEEGELVRVG